MKTVLVNPQRCLGCKQCQIACAVEHSESKSIYSAVFEPALSPPRIQVAPGIYANTSFPNKCRNCDPAPCMNICPTGATSRDPDLGIVLIDTSKCITCAMCAIVCPFDVLTYHSLPNGKQNKPVAIKCDQCQDRQRQGKIPKCVKACKVNALVFGEINELIKDANKHYAKEMSILVNEYKDHQSGIPDHVRTWREWGKTVEQMNNQ